MGKYPDLTDAEGIIMEILWRDGHTKSSQIRKEVKDTLDWSRQTVNTYLNRLLDKGFIDIKKISSRIYEYFPVISREEYAADRASSVMRKYYDGLSHMIAGFVENEDISHEDLDELDMLVKRLKKKGGKLDDINI
ncbi:MAG: BlaI/MecI/CopY family transcriptional regulator [Clostridiales bacterium]|nr:BlaI/MecI/CopY family transcriptional regulator [Clostridiales bacterium]